MPASSTFPIPVSALKPVSSGSVLWRSGGALRATFIVKISLGLVHERTAWPTTPIDLVTEERRRDANPQSSLVDAAETMPYLPNAGVILFAHACAPQGRPAPAVSARLALFRERSLIDKTVHVFGERAANAPQHPRPFERVPLVYERTWGGANHEDNPVGVPTNSGTLPSICDPTNPTRAVGFGPVSRQWPQRKRLLGAFDIARIEAPITDYPNGFDFRYFNPAPLDQQVEYLRGDEWIVLDGMHPTLPRVQSRLPQMRGKACVFFVASNSVGHSQVIDMVQDMLVVDADKLVASVVFRGSMTLESLDVLPRLRVFADVELPGNPTRWPDAAEVLRAPAPVAINSAAVPRPGVGPGFVTQPAYDKNAMGSPLPFQPKPPGTRTVLPPMAPAPPRPAAIVDDDPFTRTIAADPDESALRRAMPFMAAAPPVAGPPRIPSAVPQRPQAQKNDDATRAINLEELEARRAAMPFEESAIRSANFGKIDTSRPPPRPPDDEESTRAIDLDKLESKRAPMPFGGVDAGKPAPAPAAIPGSPWAQNKAGAVLPPAPVTRPDAISLPQTYTLDIEDPPTHGVNDHPSEVLPFMRAAAPSGSAVFEAPAPAFAQMGSGAKGPEGDPKPPMLKMEPPPMVKPPAFVDMPARVDPPAVVASVAAPAPVVPPAYAPPAPIVPLGHREPEPPAAVAPPAAIAPPAAVAPAAVAPAPVSSPVESRESTAAAAADGSSARANTGIRAVIMERLRSGVTAPLHDLSVAGADLSGLDLHGTNLSGYDLGGVKFCKANLSGTRLGGARLVDADLEGADLSRADLAGADLTRANLTNTRMSGATLDNTIFSAAQASGAILDEAKGRATLFARGHWSKASFRGIDVLGADFTGAVLDGAILERAVLIEVKLNDARGKGAKFDDARIDQAHADGATLTECSFRNVDAKGSSWENSTLDGTSFDDARMENATFVRATCKEAKFVNANLRAANFGRVQGDGANLSNANLDGADFRQARFCDARFEGARMQNILAPRADFSRGHLARADLSNGSLRAAQLGGANLSHAVLDGADLRDADLKRSILFKASRTGAKLSGANTKDAIETEPT